MRFRFIIYIFCLELVSCAAPPLDQNKLIVGNINTEDKYKNLFKVNKISFSEKILLSLSRGDRENFDQDGSIKGQQKTVFQSAFEQSLLKSGLLSNYKDPVFHINAEVLEVNSTLISAAVNTRFIVHYNIFGNNQNINFTIESKGVSEFQDNLILANRKTIANERAIHENISLFIQRIKFIGLQVEKQKTNIDKSLDSTKNIKEKSQPIKNSEVENESKGIEIKKLLNNSNELSEDNSNKAYNSDKRVDKCKRLGIKIGTKDFQLCLDSQ